jgi:predicted nucleic acid-binding Zn ribbon protein
VKESAFCCEVSEDHNSFSLKKKIAETPIKLRGVRAYNSSSSSSSNSSSSSSSSSSSLMTD